MDGRCCKKYLPSFFSVILLIRLRLDKGIHIFDILLFGKDGLIILYNLFCFHSPVPKQAVSGEGEDFCSDHIGKLLVYDIEINGVEAAYLTAGVEGKDRLQMLYIPPHRWNRRCRRGYLPGRSGNLFHWFVRQSQRLSGQMHRPFHSEPEDIRA